MTLKEQLEALLGRQLLIFWERDLAAAVGAADQRDFRRQVERHTRTLNIEDVLAGRVKASGPVGAVVSFHRGGILVRLIEVPGK